MSTVATEFNKDRKAVAGKSLGLKEFCNCVSLPSKVLYMWSDNLRISVHTFILVKIGHSRIRQINVNWGNLARKCQFCTS